MIYDYFFFFNEIDLLQIRLSEIGDYVDKIVIVEGTHTFSQNKYDSYYIKYKNLFIKYNHKIIHYIVDMNPLIEKGITNRWEYEFYLRNQIFDNLKHLNNDDIILISDVDEIPYKNKLIQGINMIKNDNIIFFHLNDFRYYLNNTDEKKEFIGPFMLKYCKLKTINNLQKEIRSVYCNHRSYDDFMRNKKNRYNEIIKHSGLHLSSFGGPRAVSYKVQSFSHSECDNKDADRIKNFVIYSPLLLHNNEKHRLQSGFYNWFKFDNIDRIKSKEDIENYKLDDRLFDEIKNNKMKYISFFILDKGY